MLQGCVIPKTLTCIERLDSIDWWLDPSYHQSGSHKDSTADDQSWDGVSDDIVLLSNNTG